MSRYQTVLLEILASEGFEDCMSPGAPVSSESIADEVTQLCADMQGQLARLAQFRDYPDLMLTAVDELMVNTDVLRVLAVARLKLELAAAEDGSRMLAAPEGAILH
ncbi:hypothetical protein LMG28727_05677 [Paraburkholderia kirstenboschensis]|jgi:hypothetical protein|uniref:hypothetical protein n=1 Tax=Paraburkholderia kirstenboschensis TaxID=1245436 RepID=UPI000AD0E4F2|nr:hypothetical protein [Paraburkholderia kirstenboschensis]CAD6554265.1 hypothetical protein LMG28727_05677 [Paraburkholderia kirstenboschensis]